MQSKILVEIYRGLICSYTAKPAGFGAEKILDKVDSGARYCPQFYYPGLLSLSVIYCQ